MQRRGNALDELKQLDERAYPPTPPPSKYAPDEILNSMFLPLIENVILVGSYRGKTPPLFFLYDLLQGQKIREGGSKKVVRALPKMKIIL